MSDHTPDPSKMVQRCEPPEDLRRVDGWHWVQAPVGPPHLARWHVADNPKTEPLWTSTHHVYPGTPRYAAREWGWRYLTPVTPPATVAALVEALEAIAGPDAPFDANPEAFGTYAARRMREQATAALAAYREAAR